MNKEELKYQSSYSTILKTKDNFETIEIIQEENVKDRNAIKVKFIEERWRTPENTIELLEKVIIVIKQNFL